MTLDEYHKIIAINGFEETPWVLRPSMVMMESFIIYAETEIDLKIHLAKVVLCRNFSATGNGEVLTDHEWFIRQFLSSYENDLVKRWVTKPIRDAMNMILSGDTFSKGILGTTFMFGIVEFYIKYFLGWDPFGKSFFDEYHQPFRSMTISQAVNKLKKTETYIAKSLNEIDNQNLKRLKERDIKIKGWVTPRISERLSTARNPMLHGEHHGFYDMGKYLCMIYILLYLHDLNKIQKSL
jgi:hypothetical protein